MYTNKGPMEVRPLNYTNPGTCEDAYEVRFCGSDADPEYVELWPWKIPAGKHASTSKYLDVVESVDSYRDEKEEYDEQA